MTPNQNDPKDPLVKIAGLVKNFGEVRALQGIDLDIERGSVVCLLGPSGSGKSTLLRCINHLEIPSEGYIRIDGEFIGHTLHQGSPRPCNTRRLAEQRRRTAMVFQNFGLFAHRTVLENVIEGPVYGQGVPKSAATAHAMELLDRVGLSDKANAYPAHISGGQQQRVAIARAMATHPEVVLFDEPTSALDPELVGEVLEVMKSLAQDGVTMVVVTHEIEFARDVASTVHFMDQGQLVESGAPSTVIDSPRHTRTQSFLANVGGLKSAEKIANISKNAEKEIHI